MSQPLAEETEITGPLAANLRISSSTADADIFAVFRVFTADLREITFLGAIDPHTPVAQGWLRASHRKCDETLSTPYRPYHSHDEVQPLQPGRPVDLAVELWPTSIVVPKGYPDCVEPAWQRLSMAGHDRRQAFQLQERTIGMRALSA